MSNRPYLWMEAMQLSKSTLFATACGAITLMIGGLSWDRWTTKPETKSLTAEQSASETTENVTLPAVNSPLAAVLPVPSSQGDWLSLPLDKGALVLFVPRVASDRVVVVRDEMGRLLDFADAKSGVPLLRQYRLDPGIYQLKMQGFADVSVSIKNRNIATIQLSPDKVSIIYGSPEILELAKGDLEAYGADIGPQNISSPEKTLYFAAELPDEWAQRGSLVPTWQ